jgi:hypothetical protein
MKVKTSNILIVLLAILFVWPVSDLDAQSRKERKLAEQAKAREIIRTVKQGGLLIELSGYGRQVAQIDDLLASEKVSEASKLKLNEKRQSLIDEGVLWKDQVIMAFDSIYSYGDFEVVYRHDRDSLKVGFDDYIVLGQGQTQSQGIDAFFFLDKNFEPLGRPMSSYIKLRSFMSLISFGDDELKYRALKLAKSTQRAFEKLEGK